MYKDTITDQERQLYQNQNPVLNHQSISVHQKVINAKAVSHHTKSKRWIKTEVSQD